MRLSVIGAVVAVLALVLVGSAIFVVYPQQQALVLQFGAVQRAITEAGLYFKVPFVQNVAYLDKRVLDLDMEPQEVIAADQKRLVVDAFARYRIADPVLFYQTVGSIPAGNARLSTFVSSALRAVVADAPFSAVVRDQRAGLMERIRSQVEQQARNLGIDIVDVRIRRADLPAANSQAIFQRMQTERIQEATRIRADGQRLATEIRSRADREALVIRATAESEAERIRGEGDAERNRIYAEAFGRDPEFFAFYRAMQAYEAGLKPSDTRLVVTPDSDFFRYFENPNGRPQTNLRSGPALPAPGAPPAAAGPMPGAAATTTTAPRPGTPAPVLPAAPEAAIGGAPAVPPGGASTDAAPLAPPAPPAAAAPPPAQAVQ